MERIDVIIADDHQLFVDCLRDVLNSGEEFNVIGTAQNGKALLDLMPGHPDALIILDINMPVMDGLQAMQRLHNDFPKSKVLGVSMFRNPEVIKKMLQAGARGYITKNCPQPELVKAMKAVANGQLYCSQDVMEQLHSTFQPDHNSLTHDERDVTKAHSLAPLSSREREVLNLIMQGKTNLEIGEELFISPRTVAAHRTNLLRKTGARNSAELVKYAVTSEMGFN